MNSLRRGAFRSVAELTHAIEEHITHHNADPKPFVWTAAASDILEKVNGVARTSIKCNLFDGLH